MILDERVLLSDQQAITATANSTNVIDLQALGITYDQVQLQRKLGKGQMIPFLVQVTEDFDNLTDLEFIFQTDDDEAFGSATDVLSIVVPLASLVAGYILPMDKLPREIRERYFRMRYVVNGVAPTAGKVTAGIVAAVDGAYVG